MRASTTLRSCSILILVGLTIATIGCTTTAPVEASGDLEERVMSLEARLADSEAAVDRLEGTVSILDGHPMIMIEAAGIGAASAEAVCPAQSVLVGGGCSCTGTAQVTRSTPLHVGCTADDEACVRSWQCGCSAGPGTARAICASVPPAS